MLKKKLLLFLLLITSISGFSQTITPQWKPITGGLMSYFYPAKSPAGYDTLWNAQKIRSYVNNGVNPFTLAIKRYADSLHNQILTGNNKYTGIDTFSVIRSQNYIAFHGGGFETEGGDNSHGSLEGSQLTLNSIVLNTYDPGVTPVGDGTSLKISNNSGMLFGFLSNQEIIRPKDGAKVLWSTSTTSYPSGSVGDGVTDDTAPLQAAINANPLLTLKPGATYKVTKLTIPASYSAFAIQGNNATINNAASTGGNSIIKQDTTGRVAVLGAIVTVNPVKNDSTMTVSSATGINAGDHIILRTTEAVGTANTTYLKGEIMTVRKVAGNVITFRQPFTYDMIAANISVAKASTLKLNIENLNLVNYNATDTVINGAYLRDVSLKNITITPITTANVGINLSYTYGADVENFKGRNFTGTGSGYAVNIEGRDILINHPIVSGAFHGTTSAGRNFISHNITVSNADISNSSNFGIDFHGNVIDATVQNSAVYNSNGGITYRGTSGFSVINNTVTNINGDGIYLNPEATRATTKIKITQNKVIRSNLSLTGGAIDIFANSSVSFIDVLENTIDGCLSRGIFLAETNRRADNATVSGNTILNVGFHGILIKGSNLTISNNKILSFGQSIVNSYGIGVKDTTSNALVYANQIFKTATNDQYGILLNAFVNNSIVQNNQVSTFAQANSISQAGLTGTGNIIRLNYKANGFEDNGNVTNNIGDLSYTSGVGGDKVVLPAAQGIYLNTATLTAPQLSSTIPFATAIGVNVTAGNAALLIGTNANSATAISFNSRSWIGYDGTNLVLQGGGSKGISFNVNNTFGLSQAALLSTTGVWTWNSYTTAGILHNTTAGVVTSSLVNLATEVSGVLPATNGGVNNTVTAINATYPVTIANQILIADPTTAAFTATLPTAVGNTGKTFTFKRSVAGANVFTIATTSSQTIDGITTYTLTAQYKYVTVASNGANWIIIANN